MFVAYQTKVSIYASIFHYLKAGEGQSLLTNIVGSISFSNGEDGSKKKDQRTDASGTFWWNTLSEFYYITSFLPSFLQMTRVRHGQRYQQEEEIRTLMGDVFTSGSMFHQKKCLHKTSLNIQILGCPSKGIAFAALSLNQLPYVTIGNVFRNKNCLRTIDNISFSSIEIASIGQKESWTGRTSQWKENRHRLDREVLTHVHEWVRKPNHVSFEAHLSDMWFEQAV